MFIVKTENIKWKPYKIDRILYDPIYIKCSEKESKLVSEREQEHWGKRNDENILKLGSFEWEQLYRKPLIRVGDKETNWFPMIVACSAGHIYTFFVFNILFIFVLYILYIHLFGRQSIREIFHSLIPTPVGAAGARILSGSPRAMAETQALGL